MVSFWKLRFESKANFLICSAFLEQVIHHCLHLSTSKNCSLVQRTPQSYMWYEYKKSCYYGRFWARPRHSCASGCTWQMAHLLQRKQFMCTFFCLCDNQVGPLCIWVVDSFRSGHDKYTTKTIMICSNRKCVCIHHNSIDHVTLIFDDNHLLFLSINICYVCKLSIYTHINW